MSEKPLVTTAAHAAFPATQWSLVLRASQGGSAEAGHALEMLCRSYWAPLYAYARRDGLTPHDAQDVTQAFLAHLLRRDDLASVSRDKGRFRSFLLASLKNFLVSRARAEQALKRGGGAEPIALDMEQAEELCRPELTEKLSPDKAFDRRWALTIMARALERLALEHKSPPQARLFTALQPVLADSGRMQNQATLAAELGVTPGALATAATRLRQRYRALIEDEVKSTLENPADLAEEMRVLREAWS